MGECQSKIGVAVDNVIEEFDNRFNKGDADSADSAIPIKNKPENGRSGQKLY